MKYGIFSIALLLFSNTILQAQESPKEEDFYKIVTLPVPENILIEAGGLCLTPQGNLAIATRRGDIWIVENPSSKNPNFRKFASGMHEILGLEYRKGSFYCAQRGELTKVSDYNGDGTAESYETVYAWELSGHYHEYSFGPKIDPNGDFFISGNVAFGDEEWWRGESRKSTRGTIFKITKDGKYEPFAAGVRSPAGLGMIDGELFYTDNQGDWMGSGGIFHVTKGTFMGHPASLSFSGSQNLTKITERDFYAARDKRQTKDANGAYIKPENIDKEKTQTLAELKSKFPSIQTPAVWLPHGVLGVSNSELIKDDSQGGFGPFAGQIFVGDQGQSKIMRVSMEKINGQYQGAAWDFRSGFQSGVMRLVMDEKGSLYVGETNRGWGSAGETNQGIQRLIWNGKVPFEMLDCKAKSDGFEITFTHPIDRRTAQNLGSYSIKSFTYKHHAVYGSPPVNEQKLKVKGIQLSEDAKTLRLVIDGLRKEYIHELNLTGIRSKENAWSLVHPTVYYTLNQIPNTPKLGNAATIPNTKPTNTSSKPASNSEETQSPDNPASKATGKITFEQIKPLLQKNTCTACHAEDRKLVGPAFKLIAKRGYSVDRIVQLIYKPEPQNWPDYATPMAAMPQVPKSDAVKIANYIRGLK
ncbi:MAG: hypothetical protein ACRCVT_13845 [Leadbetterella sp.]